MVATPEEVLGFWLEELEETQWYISDPDVDATIRERFLSTWEAAHAGQLETWRCGGRNSLAYLIVTDQFARNLWRGDGRSFATDARARSAAMRAIARKWDLQIDPPARQFFYMPLCHSESLSDQERAMRMYLLRMPQSESHDHTAAHRWIIRQFGRFPFRNAALGRQSTGAEAAFLEDGGYSAALAAVRAA